MAHTHWAFGGNHHEDRTTSLRTEAEFYGMASFGREQGRKPGSPAFGIKDLTPRGVPCYLGCTVVIFEF